MKLALFLLASVAAFGQVPRYDISWTPSATPGLATLLERADGTCGTAGQVFTALTAAPIALPTTKYSDTTVVRGKSYCFRAFAVSGLDKSLPSNTVEAVLPPPLLPPGLSGTLQIALMLRNSDGTVASNLSLTVPLEAGQ